MMRNWTALPQKQLGEAGLARQCYFLGQMATTTTLQRSGIQSALYSGGARDKFDELEDSRDAKDAEDLDDSDDPRVAGRRRRHVSSYLACLRRHSSSHSPQKSSSHQHLSDQYPLMNQQKRPFVLPHCQFAERYG